MGNAKFFAVRPGRIGALIMFPFPVVMIGIWATGLKNTWGNPNPSHVPWPTALISVGFLLSMTILSFLIVGWYLFGEEQVVSDGENFFIRYRIGRLPLAPTRRIKKVDVQSTSIEMDRVQTKGRVRHDRVLYFRCSNRLEKTRVPLSEKDAELLMLFVEEERKS